MSIAITPNDPRVRLLLNGVWTDVYRRVRQADGGSIEIELGNDNEALGDEINPGKCALVFDNMDGAFNPDNPTSPYWPYLSINTRICVLMDELRDTYSRTAPNTWGITDTGETYLTKSAGGAISATDYSTNGTVGKHSVPAVASYRMSYFDASSGGRTAHNLVQKIRFTLPFTNVTGGPLEPGNLVCRMQSDTQYYMCRLTVEADESVKIAIYRDGGTVLAAAVTVPGIANLAGQGVWVMFGAFDSLLCANAWVGDNVTDEPTGWLTSATDTNYGYGWYGVRTGVSATNTNALPIDVSYDHYSVYNSLFNGEIAEFPQEFSDDGKDMIVPISAGGLLRRFAESKTPRVSAPRYLYETGLGIQGMPPDYYWPLDDGELSSEGRSTVGVSTSPFHFNFALGVLQNLDTSHEKHFSQAKLGSWLPNGVNVLNTEIFQALPPLGTADCVNDEWIVHWVRTGGSESHDQFAVNGYLDPGVFILGVNGDIIAVEFDATIQRITVSPGIGAGTTVINATTLPTNVFDGAAHHFQLFATVSGGTGLGWELTADDHVIGTGTVAAHPFLANIGAVYMSGMGAKPSGVGHVALFLTHDPGPFISTIFSRFTGSLGELADDRVGRYCQESGITRFTVSGNGQQMGPQFVGDTLYEQFEEIVRTDGGILREDIGTRGLRYDTLTDLRGHSVIATINVGGIVGSEPLAKGGFKPVRDSQRLKNKVIATKRAGADYIYQKTTGRLGTLSAGAYEGEAKANPALDSQLVTIAQREVAEGTVDKPRYPEVTVDLMARSITTNTSLRRSILRLFISQRIKLTSMTRWHVYEDADLLVIGTKRSLTPYEHKITFNTVPFNSLDIFHVETAGSILGTANSYITTAVTTAGTALDVVTDAHALWTTDAGSMPIRAKIEGEDVDISSIVTTAPTFRSVGAASHADNAATAPGLPAGHVLNDTLCLVTAIRNTAATANLPAGYQILLDLGHIKVCLKTDNGAEGVPNCTYSGGAAGDTTSSVLMAFQNCPFNYLNSVPTASITNGSVQNIAYPALIYPRSNGLAVLIGWKQDDYTSIGVPTGLTEIIEASTVTGNDQSLYAAYISVPFAHNDFQAGSLVVTGGAAAISKGIVIYFANPQRMTVARSINGVVKAHGALAPIGIAYPKVLG